MRLASLARMIVPVKNSVRVIGEDPTSRAPAVSVPRTCRPGPAEAAVVLEIADYAAIVWRVRPVPGQIESDSPGSQAVNATAGQVNGTIEAVEDVADQLHHRIGAP